jgi:elongation factor 1-gamma
MKEFWNKFDPNGYSFWWMQYQKLPSEGKVLFKTNNSSSFFLQKVDSFRKYAFAAHGVYGVEGEYEIRGVWMWRGTEIPEEMQSHDSFPFMTIKKLDPSNEADRKLVEDYWLNINEGAIVDGLPVAEVVHFK